ncbi:acyl carrier protein [Vicingus serpentipes]|uniref:Acyl carrier protein n=1 Tax=Vicingus serpentipes TaxID=1926625 RepID=A0A5C6RPT8_9FLAO|nr:acyl carrier protein [Vicingus serpentipes]TXB64213.1 acyl carrier protein [Vicingus serpentipes]
MGIQDLIKKLENELDEVENGSLTPETSIRDVEWWSSMHALVIIALIDTEYDVAISGADLKTIFTIQDIFNVIQEKKKNGSN